MKEILKHPIFFISSLAGSWYYPTKDNDVSPLLPLSQICEYHNCQVAVYEWRSYWILQLKKKKKIGLLKKYPKR